MAATTTMTMIVLVTLRAGVNPEEYERWVSETYRPALLATTTGAAASQRVSTATAATASRDGRRRTSA